MPYSDSNFDDTIRELMRNSDWNRFLDIGAGSGKYGRLIKSERPNAFVIGVECWKPYITEFNLNAIYDQVISTDIMAFIDGNRDFSTDAVVLGDCIEHLRKSDGIDLLNFLLYRTKAILVIFPTKFIQYTWRRNPYEAHMSAWCGLLNKVKFDY